MTIEVKIITNRDNYGAVELIKDYGNFEQYNSQNMGPADVCRILRFIKDEQIPDQVQKDFLFYIKYNTLSVRIENNPNSLLHFFAANDKYYIFFEAVAKKIMSIYDYEYFDTPNQDGQTAYQIACQNNNNKAIQLLTEEYYVEPEMEWRQSEPLSFTTIDDTESLQPDISASSDSSLLSDTELPSTTNIPTTASDEDVTPINGVSITETVNGGVINIDIIINKVKDGSNSYSSSTVTFNLQELSPQYIYDQLKDIFILFEAYKVEHPPLPSELVETINQYIAEHVSEVGDTFINTGDGLKDDNKVRLIHFFASYSLYNSFLETLLNSDDPQKYLHLQSKELGMPIHTAALHNNIEGMKTIIKYDNNVNLLDSQFMNFTPLHYAALYGNIEAVKLLIEHGADVNKTSLTRCATPFYYACNEQHHNVAAYLITHGSEISIANYSNNMLTYITDKHARKTLQKLVEAQKIHDSEEDLSMESTVRDYLSVTKRSKTYGLGHWLKNKLPDWVKNIFAYFLGENNFTGKVKSAEYIEAKQELTKKIEEAGRSGGQILDIKDIESNTYFQEKVKKFSFEMSR